MNYFSHTNLFKFHILLQIFVFLGDISQSSSSLTYRQSSQRCKGEHLGEKPGCNCDENERLGRIIDSASLQEVKNIISDDKPYWIGLSYREGKGFCWITEKYDRCDERPADQKSLTKIIQGEKDDWESGWYCFLVRKSEAKMRAKKCQDNEHFICEKENPSSSVKSEQSETLVSKETATEPTSTTKSFVVKGSSPSFTTPRMSTEMSPIFDFPKATTTTPVGVASLKLTSTPVYLGLTSNTKTAEPMSIVFGTTIKEALTSAATPSSQTEALTDSIDLSRGRLSSKDELRRFYSVIQSLNASEQTSIQIAREAIISLMRSLKEDPTHNKGINILSATQQLETFANSYGRIHLKANEEKIISGELFAMKIHKVPANNKKSIVFSAAETRFSGTEGKAKISLPSGLFNREDSVVVSTLYDGIKRWIPASEIESDGRTLTNLKLRSRVIASAVYPEPSGILVENVTISLSYDEETQNAGVPHCVFWDFNRKSEVNGSWSTTGCSLVESNDNQVTCSCNHLTNFAVLMQVGDTTMSTDHEVALDVITYVGCGLSLAGELLTIIAYVSLMDLRQEQIQIHFNLVVAIAIAQLVFLCGVDSSEAKGVCIFVATLIHYFYLAGFVWMLIEGVYLYLMVVKVFNTVVKMRFFYAISWGFPLLMVLLSLLFASGLEGGVNNYVHDEFCWVSFSNNLIWTFAAPVLVVCMINSGLLTRVIYEIIYIQGDRTSDLEKIRQGSKAVVVLFPLLGLTWGFGILSITDAGLVFQYIFTTLNSVQGLFIFVLHVLKNGEVRAAFRRKRQKWIESRNISTSRVSSHSMTAPTKKLGEEKADEMKNMGRQSPCSVTGYMNQTDVEQDRTLTPVQM